MRSLLSLGWLLLVLACEVPCVPSREAISVLGDIAAGEGPSSLKEATPPPRRQLLEYRVDGRARSGDLYLPAQAARAGIVVVAGASTGGKNDPRLIAIANTLARVRFAVLVPEMASLAALKVKPSDIAEIAAAFTYLSSRPDLAPAGRAGIGAVSYSVGPALLAALEPAIRDRVRFIIGVGSYYDLRRVLFAPRGNPYLKVVFLESNLDLVNDASDRRILEAMASRLQADPSASLDELSKGLGPEGRSVYALISNPNSGRVPELVSELPPAVRFDLDALDLARHDLSSLRARVTLIHGYEDDVIPFTESVALLHALPPGRAKLILTHGLNHTRLRQVGFGDRLRLACAVNAILDQQAVAPRPSPR